MHLRIPTPSTAALLCPTLSRSTFARMITLRTLRLTAARFIFARPFALRAAMRAIFASRVTAFAMRPLRPLRHAILSTSAPRRLTASSLAVRRTRTGCALSRISLFHEAAYLGILPDATSNGMGSS